MERLKVKSQCISPRPFFRTQFTLFSLAATIHDSSQKPSALAASQTALLSHLSNLKLMLLFTLFMSVLTCLSPDSTVLAGGASRCSYASYSQSAGRCRGAGNCHFRFFIFHQTQQCGRVNVGRLFSPPLALSELLERLECPQSTRLDLWYPGIFYETPTFDLQIIDFLACLPRFCEFLLTASCPQLGLFRGCQSAQSTFKVQGITWGIIWCSVRPQRLTCRSVFFLHHFADTSSQPLLATFDSFRAARAPRAPPKYHL